jgi:uncharacterized protein (TIGR02246 family)
VAPRPEDPVDPRTAAPESTTRTTNDDLEAVREMHASLLRRWNRRSAHSFAAHFLDDGTVVGFDGSEMNGQAEIAETLGRIFLDHPTGKYIAKVREVRRLAPDIVLLRAVAGMVPHGQTDLKPELNTIQSLVAVRRGNDWRVAHYHNTPAALHGRPEAVAALTAELRELMASQV